MVVRRLSAQGSGFPPVLQSQTTLACALAATTAKSAVAATSSSKLRSGELLRLIEVLLAGLGLRDQRGRRVEALAVGGGELTRAGDEAGEAPVVAVGVLEDAARPAGEPDAHDRPDVRVGDRLDHALVEALDRL